MRLALCIAVSAVFLYLAVRGIDFDRVLQEVKKSSPAPIAGAVGFLFVSFWIRAYRWRYLLSPIKEISVPPLFRSAVIGFMGNYLLPFRAGEVMRAVSIGQTQRISKAAALGSIVLERAFDGIALALTPFLLLAVVDLPSWLVRASIASLAILIAGLTALIFATRREWVAGWLQHATNVLPNFVGGRLGSLAEEFFRGMKGINHAGALLPVLILSLICWLFHGLYFFLLFEALDLNLSFWAALVLQMVIGLGVILPAAPGYVGNFEYFTLLGLALFNVSQETAFAYALLAHVCQFVPVSVVGLFFALRNGFHPEVEAVSGKGVEVEV